MELSSIYAPVRDDLERVEQCLEAVARVDIPLLAQLLEYILEGRGKLVRPSLTLLAGKFHNYNLTLLVPMAVAVELLHAATLVHDDVIDNSMVRRGKPTVNSRWDEDKALLLGDYLFAKAGDLVASTENLRAVKLFARVLMTISGGELGQADIQFDLTRARDNYYRWISAKTASLFVMAAESGAALSQASEDTIGALRDYAYNMGMAFQIVDDILDVIGKEAEVGKPVGSDLSQGTLTLPSILFAERYPDDDSVKRAVESRDTQHVGLAVEKIGNSPIIGECFAIASGFSSKACQCLEVLPDNAPRKALFSLAEYIVLRSK